MQILPNTIIMRQLAIIISITGMLCSCSGNSAVKEAAESFISSYLSTDYTKASEYCTKEYGKMLNEATQQFGTLPNAISSAIKERASKLTLTIEEPKKVGKSDTISVSYSIIGESFPIDGSMLFVMEDDSWKICGLGKK